MGRYLHELEKLSRPQDRGFSEIFNDDEIASSVESVLFPLYSCVQVIQSKNPHLITFPELIVPSSRMLTRDVLGTIVGSTYSECGSVLGKTSGGIDVAETIISIAGAIAPKKDDDIGSSLERSLKKGLKGKAIGSVSENDKEVVRQEVAQAIDDNAFDLYCKCRQFIEVAKGKLRPEEEQVLYQVISRTEGESYRRRYDELIHPRNMKRNEDKEIKPLILPDDFFHNPSYFDPSASTLSGIKIWLISICCYSFDC